ncbi:6-bladed beta-propeller [Cecembia rubra]|uniref:6-bladed beta-propeller n=1 Tax=Cecembia rubra TaxID=1485585 RepID=UPI002714D04E|nr:6-bladed beta-propeller [Cecembia rubra]
MKSTFCGLGKGNYRSNIFTKYLLLTLIVIFFQGCYGKRYEDRKDKNSEPLPKYTVNVHEEYPIESLFELKEIIPINIEEKNFLVDIYRLQVSEENFYLLDKEFGTLIKTSNDGYQIAKIGKFGSGPDELPDIADFSLSEASGELLLISIEERSLAFFDLEGNFKRKIKLKNQSDMLSVDGKGKIGMSITYFNEEFSNFELLDSAGKSIKRLFPFPKDVFPIILKNISGHITKGYEGGILYQEPANSVIYEINQDEHFPKYQFLSSQPIWPQDKKHQLNSFFETLATGELSFPTRFFEESENHLYFGWNKEKNKNSQKIVDFRVGVFDKQNNRTYLTRESPLTSFLSGPMAVEGNSVYFIIPLFKLLDLSDEPVLESYKTEIIQLKNKFQDLDFPVILKMNLKILLESD